MPSSADNPGLLHRDAKRRLRHSALLALAYFIAGALAQTLTLQPENITPVWPSAGIALTAMILCGRQLWPGVFFGHLLVSLYMSGDLSHGPTLANLLLFTVTAGGASVQALAGAALLGWRFGAGNPLSNSANTLRVLLLAGPATCLVSASVGITALTLGGHLPADAALRSWLIWWGGDVTGVLLVAPLLLGLQHQPEGARLRWFAMIALPTVAAVIATALMYDSARSEQRLLVNAEFSQRAQRTSLLLEERLTRYVSTAQALQGYLSTHPEASRRQFDQFSNVLLQHNPGIQALQWLPKVRRAERAAYVARARADGLTDFDFTDRDASGQLSIVGEQPVYYPVYYSTPLAGNEKALGLAPSYLPTRRQAIETARDSGRAAASAPIRLVQERGEQAGVLLLLPVYSGSEAATDIAERRARFRGLAQLVWRIGDVVAATLKADHDLLLRLEDQHAPAERALLFNSSHSDTPPSPAHRTSFEIGGRLWALQLYPATPLASSAGWQTAALLIAGLGLSVSLQAFLILLTGRNREIIQTVTERTAALSLSNRDLQHEIDERRQAEQAAHAAHQRLQDAIDTMQDGFCLYDEQDRLVLCNQRYRELYADSAAAIEPGNSFEQILRYGLERGQYAQAVGQEGAWLAERLEQHRRGDYQLQIEQHLGNGHWLQIKERRMAGGNIVGIRSDISALKQAEAALRESEQRWQFALEGANDGVWDWNPKTDEAYFSPRWISMLGYDADEIEPSGKQWGELIHPDDSEAVYAALQRHLSGESPDYAPEFRLRCKNGRYKWIHARGKVIEHDADGQPLRVIGIHTDISARKATEQVLEQERRLFVAGPTVIFRWTNQPDWPMEYVSPNIESVFGYRPDQLCSGEVRFSDIVHPNDFQRVTAEMAEHGAAGREHFEQHYRVRTRAGDWRWIYDLTTIIRDDDGVITHYQGYLLDNSAQREASLALVESEARYRELVEHSTMAIHIHSLGRLVFLNREAVRLLGGESEAEFLGQPIETLWAPQQRGMIAARIATLYAGGDSAPPCEEQFYRRDGTLVDVEVSGSRIEYAGAPAIQVIYHDISERLRAEEALRESESRHRTLVEHSPMPILIHCEGLVVFINHEAVRQLGGDSAADFIGKPALNIVAAEDHAAVQALQQQLYDQADSVSEPIERRLVKKNGEQIVCEVVGGRIDFIGKPAVQVMFRDITARNRAEEALRQSEARFRELAENTGVIPWESDYLSGQFTYVGPQTLSLLGYRPEQWYEKDFWPRHTHPDDRDWVPRYCAEQSGQRDQYDFEYRMLAADGRTVWLRDIVSVQRNQAGPFGLRGYLIDITEARELQEELQNHRDNLRELVEQRTGELAEAMDEAIAANRAKSEFLANMSHELRTPMHGVLSFARLGAGKAGRLSSDKLAHYFQRIETSGERLMSLLNDLLDLSKLEAGRLELQHTEGNLCNTLEAVGEEFQASLTEHQLRLDIQPAPGCDTPLPYDHDRMLQVMRNLLSNAIKFSPKNSCIELCCRRMDDSALISLRDHGPGIPADELDAVFDKFIQSSSTNTGAGGTGLGLAICRQIVELHGGRIHAENHPDGGALICVQLPVNPKSEAAGINPTD